ncbi:class I SAM-dependent methyltransferase [Sulfurimonas sp.]|uniref:class I SAM-dependent DNA methyltransferase n=1 Tax=Sulfurimonas sp. TaxID=2022749 RepID=UPI00356436AE
MADNFENKAKEWDNKSVRVQNAHSIAHAIKEKIELNKNMHIMDFGVGTGLLGFEVLKDVKSMDGVDTSEAMLEKLEEKNTETSFIKPICQDIVKKPLDTKYDGIISSMTLHHVEHLDDFFKTIKTNLNENGFIAIADLASEDGTFHSDNTGVHHFGFDEKELETIIRNCGFTDIAFKHIHTINKPHRDFDIFLVTAKA